MHNQEALGMIKVTSSPKGVRRNASPRYFMFVILRGITYKSNGGFPIPVSQNGFTRRSPNMNLNNINPSSTEDIQLNRATQKSNSGYNAPVVEHTISQKTFVSVNPEVKARGTSQKRARHLKIEGNLDSATLLSSTTYISTYKAKRENSLSRKQRIHPSSSSLISDVKEAISNDQKLRNDILSALGIDLKELQDVKNELRILNEKNSQLFDTEDKNELTSSLHIDNEREDDDHQINSKEVPKIADSNDAKDVQPNEAFSEVFENTPRDTE